MSTVKQLYMHVMLGGGQLVLVFVGMQVQSRQGWAASLGLVAAISLLAWRSVYRRARAVEDTPTSNIASAAQGYVELFGEALDIPGPPTLAPYSHMPCVWCRYVMEQRAGRDWRCVDQGETEASFLLADDSGRCVVDPEGAEVLATDKNVWIEGDYRYTEWKLFAHDSLYVLGEFRTLSNDPGAADMTSDVSALLAEWKRDRPGLLARFDRDRDGNIDLDEWEQARKAARAAVEKNYREMRAAPRLDGVRAPADGRMYLISNLMPAQLARRYRVWVVLHLAIFIAALGGLARALA